MHGSRYSLTKRFAVTLSPPAENPLSVRLLIADDSEMLRIGIRTLVEYRRDWQVCGEAANGEEAVARVRELAPDVVILDLSMPIMNGFQAAEEIRRSSPATKIVFFSVHEVPSTARTVGADAFVSKSAPASQLLATVERVIAPQ